MWYYSSEMLFLTIGFIILQFVYILYQDVANRKERHHLELKLMSKTPDEYSRAVEKPSPNAESAPDPYIPVEEVPVKKLMQAEDRL